MAAWHAGNLEGWHAGAGIGDLDLDLAVVELAGPQPLAKGIARGKTGAGADQRIDHALLGIQLRLGLDLFSLGVADEPDAGFQEIADDLIDVAADVADLGELGRLDLDEGRAGKLGEAARDLGLADAGRPDHQDVLGQDLLAQLLVELLAAPAVAQRNGDGALGVALADDVAVELGDDLARGKAASFAFSAPFELQAFDDDFLVGVNADIGGDGHGFARNRLRVEVGVEQRAGSGERDNCRRSRCP